MREICSKIELIPLEELPDSVLDSLDLSRISISEDRIIIKNGGNAISVYDGHGGYLSTIQVKNGIRDFSVFGNKSIDILSDHEILGFSLSDLSPTVRYHLAKDDSSTLKLEHMIRRIENEYLLWGYSGNVEFTGDYIVDRNYYGMSVNNINIRCEDRTMIVRKGGFLHRDFETFRFYSSGEIWECLGLSHPYMRWNFGRQALNDTSFTNVQMTKEKAYLSFLYKKKQHMMIVDRNDKKYEIICGMHGKLEFPLGTIMDKANYFCCPGTSLEKYIDQELLDAPDKELFQSLRDKTSIVVLKYIMTM